MRIATLFTLVLVVVIVSLASAGEMQRVKAIGVAETALGRAVAVGSAQIIPKEKLRDAVPGDLYLVHNARTLEQAYGIVPILSPDGKVVGLIGVDREANKAIWYSFSPRGETFPPVSARTARRRIQLKAGPAGQEVQAGEPILVSGCDKHLYWRFETGAGEAFYVDSDRSDAEILSSRDGSADKVTVAPVFAAEQKAGPREAHESVNSTPAPILTNGVRPAAYDIPGVPYHYQLKDDYCGCAAVQMALDYHGEEIPQEDVADVIKEVLADYSVFNDAGKAFSFSPMSTSKNDPTLQGYNERELGYANLYYNWVSSTKEERRGALKDIVLTNHPANIGGWFGTSHGSGHWRLLKGYDDSLNVFVFHDPWYAGQPSGPNLLIDQDVWLDDLWNTGMTWDYQARIGLPWVLTTDFPGTVSQGDTFTVDLKVVYPGVYPPYGQNHTDELNLSIALSSGLTLASGTSTISLTSLFASGDSATVSWDVVASGAAGTTPGMGFAAMGIIDYWAYSYGTSQDSIGGHSYEIVEITSTLAADWGAEERLTNDGLSSETCVPHARSMAVEDDGTTHIVWQDTDAGGSYIRYMKRMGGTWQAPVEISPDGHFCHSPCVAVSPSGGVHIAWIDRYTGNGDVYYKSWTSGGGWSANEQVTTLNEVECFPCIAADDDLVHIAYEQRQGGLFRAHAVFHTFRNAIAWSVPVDVDAAAARDSFRPSLAIGADGLLHIVYERHTANEPNELEKVVHKSWDGVAWSTRTGLSSGLSHARTPSIAACDDSTLHVVWRDGENVGGDIFYSKYDGAAWQLVPDEIVTGTTEASTPSVAVDDNGSVFVAWVDHRHSESEIYLMQGGLVEIFPGFFIWQWIPSRFTNATGHSMLPCVCAVGDESVSVLWTDLRHGSPEIYYRGPDDDSGIPTDSATPEGALLRLSLPRPQPFTSDVRMSLNVDQAADVSIEVYDITGRVVCELGQDWYGPGTFNITWNGRSSSGDRVSPGVYFVSCKSTLGNEVRRVVMVR